ncbi:hypothetical protein D9M68_366370 [compost metagenome]
MQRVEVGMRRHHIEILKGRRMDKGRQVYRLETVGQGRLEEVCRARICVAGARAHQVLGRIALGIQVNDQSAQAFAGADRREITYDC